MSTVNQELKSKVEELSRSNSDLQNLMAATQIATVFLDRNLCIQRYTPPAVALFNLIQTDVGRPISDLTPRLDYPGLAVDAARVLAHLGAVALEVAHEDGRYFLARMLPYRTTSDHIAGVVLTFVDITERKRGEAALSESMRQLEQQTRIFNTTLSAIADFAYIFDRAGRFLYANRALTDLLGLDDGSLTGKTFRDLPYPPELAAKLMRQIQQVIETRETLTDETPFVTPATQTRVYEYIFRPVLSADGASVGVRRGIDARHHRAQTRRTPHRFPGRDQRQPRASVDRRRDHANGGRKDRRVPRSFALRLRRCGRSGGGSGRHAQLASAGREKHHRHVSPRRIPDG